MSKSNGDDPRKPLIDRFKEIDAAAMIAVPFPLYPMVSPIFHCLANEMSSDDEVWIWLSASVSEGPIGCFVTKDTGPYKAIIKMYQTGQMPPGSTLVEIVAWPIREPAEGQPIDKWLTPEEAKEFLWKE